MDYELEVNGRRHTVTADPMTPLVVVLRDYLGMRGTKVACWQGRCGACTVELDGKAVVSCILPVAQAALPHRITTIEGLAAPGESLDPVQEEMVRGGGIQCGACTPGMVMSIHAALTCSPALSAVEDADVRRAIAGNICRCTGYQRIVDAAMRAGQRVRSDMPCPSGGDGGALR